MKSNGESFFTTLNLSPEAIARANDMAAHLEGVPSSRGRELCKKHFSGEVLGNAPAIIAKCCECSGYYVDGRNDCEVYTCPLYPHMPYGKMRKRYTRPDRIKQKPEDNNDHL